MKTMFGKSLLVIILFNMLFLGLKACQYTVREIGFSSLSAGIYTLFVIDAGVEPADSGWISIHQELKNSNIQLVFLNSLTEGQHPVIKKLQESNTGFPVKVLISPSGKILELPNESVEKVVYWVLDSPTRKLFREFCTKHLAVVLWVEGKNKDANIKTEKLIKDVSEKVKLYMPNLPKQVSKGPQVLRITAKTFQQEKVLFWSLGLDSLPEEPVAFVLYGRGRFMGERVDYKLMGSNALFELLLLAGSDCECMVDRYWMLGKQIPLWWPEENRQNVFDELEIDVENPLILSHMSRIMKMSFAPLEYFSEYERDNVPEIVQKTKQNEEKKVSFKLFIILTVLLSFVIGILLYVKKRNYTR